AYAHPFSDRPNLTIMTGAHVRRIPIDQRRAIGVDIEKDGRVFSVGARSELILSTGAINTPSFHGSLSPRKTCESARNGPIAVSLLWGGMSQKPP
ncbi:hypothetical protein FK514_28270, partial [Klebsiella pneumoniae]|uniref:GMC family oxidoreductase N-terminal domain-containing protein n=1 Tax=Klebsiella pneumoniae TaxID=573 RepID=UPI00210E42E2